MTSSLILYYITPPGYIEVSVFDALWALNDPINSTNRKDFFRVAYRMPFDVVEVEPDVFIDVYRFAGSWWPNVYLLYATGDPICLEYCKLVRFPE